MFVSSQCEDILLNYFLEHQPQLRERIHFYMQICEAISHLHEHGFIICYCNPMHIMVIDGKKQVSLS